MCTRTVIRFDIVGLDLSCRLECLSLCICTFIFMFNFICIHIKYGLDGAEGLLEAGWIIEQICAESSRSYVLLIATFLISTYRPLSTRVTRELARLIATFLISTGRAAWNRYLDGLPILAVFGNTGSAAEFRVGQFVHKRFCSID